MEEDIHPNDDKETLRRRLELLKQEYEWTARRLQKAEHRDAIRRQSSVSHQKELPHNESSLCSTSSSVPTSELSDNQNAQQLQTNIVGKRNSSVFSPIEKIPSIHFQLDEITSASPSNIRSPAHRLRSKRSRLRLQIKGRESDTDYSQEKESLIQEKSGSTAEGAKMKKERDFEMLQFEVEQNQDLPIKEKEDTIAKKPQLKVIKKTEVSCELQSSIKQFTNKPLDLSEDSNDFQSRPDVKLQSRTAAHSDPIQTSVRTDKSQVILLPDSNKDIKYSSVMSGALDSCTLVEGLPFPVEYYIRTTRRMAASQSSVNLEAVIQSQLSGGRGRRRLSQPQMRGRGHVNSELSESVCRSTDQAGRRGRGQRKRGRRKTTIVRSPCSKDASDCIISNPASDSQADCSVLIESKSSPQSESTGQSELEDKPQVESQPIPSPEPTENVNPSKEDGVAQDFKHLPDSQLYFESKLLPDSNLYPIFRRGRGQTGGHSSQSQTCMSKNDQSPLLPSLASLIQALQEKDTNNGLLAAIDIQDFHLPDEDFGQLKLKKLCLSTSLMEPFVQRVYNTRRSNRRQTTSGVKSEVLGEELFTPEPPTSSTLEDSLPLCQSDPVDQSQTETQNTKQKHVDLINKLNSRSSDGMDSVQEQTWTMVKTEKCAEDANNVSDKYNINTQTSETVHMPNVDPQIRTDSHPLFENSPLCPALLDLSPSLTSNTQRGQDPSLPSLGTTPLFLSPASPTDLHPRFRSPTDSRRSPSSNVPAGCVSPDSVSSKTFGNVRTNTSTKSSELDTERQKETEVSQEIKPQTPPQNNIATERDNFIAAKNALQDAKCRFDTENSPECRCKINSTPEIETQLNNNSESAARLIPDIQNTQNNPKTEVQTCHTQKDMNQCVDASGCAGDIEAISLDTSTNQRTEDKTVCITNADEAMGRATDSSITTPELKEDLVPSTFLDAGHCSAMLQETHTFKALEGGCVLDLCLVRWSLEDSCICVAGEWSVCLWAQKKGGLGWSLLHTWTFAQSVISLQVIPDSSGLLCVTLGHLEITEARVLCCPSMDGPFTQNVVCKDALQAVVGVSNSRLVCCSTPGDPQTVTVIMLTKDGREVKSLSLVSAKQNIRTLVAVEGEKDALIGWTECKTVLIWSMKTGHLLQTIYLEKTLPMTNCLRGYSYRGVLCVLLQNTGNVCEEKSNKTLFTLIATNPLTGKHITLISISSPAQHIQQLIDGDVFGSGLVGVFQSGHIAVWDLRGRVPKVVGVLDELCRLARWAGPDTLLTGYLNGDVSMFQYKTV